MACCEILKDYTVGSEEEVYYYNAQYEAEVQIYILHCMQERMEQQAKEIADAAKAAAGAAQANLLWNVLNRR